MNIHSFISCWKVGPWDWDFPIPIEYQWWILLFCLQDLYYVVCIITRPPLLVYNLSIVWYKGHQVGAFVSHEHFSSLLRFYSPVNPLKPCWAVQLTKPHFSWAGFISYAINWQPFLNQRKGKDNNLIIFFLFFTKNRLCHFIQIVCRGDSLHKVSKPIFWKTKKNILKCPVLKFLPWVLSTKGWQDWYRNFSICTQ